MSTTAARVSPAGGAAERAAEKAFCGLGPVAEALITGAAGAGRGQAAPAACPRPPAPAAAPYGRPFTAVHAAALQDIPGVVV